MSSAPPWVDQFMRSLTDEARAELTKTVRLMVGAMNALFDQLEAERRDDESTGSNQEDE